MLNELDPLFILTLTTDYHIDSIQHVVNFLNHNRKYERGVLNAVLLKAIRYKRNYIPNKIYLEQVLNSFVESNTLTVNKAARDLNNNLRYSSNNNKENKPEWLDEYIGEIKNMKG